MRIFPFALIAFGVFGVLKHFGLIDSAFLQLFWPLLLIAVGVLMLALGPRWRAGMHDRLHDRFERRMHRRFGPGWNNLSEEERERFRAGMRHGHCHGGGSSAASARVDDGAPTRAPGEQR